MQGGYGACFCHQGTEFCEHYACRGTSFIGGRELVKVQKIRLRTLAQCRGTSSVGAGKLSRYAKLCCEQCGCPGTLNRQELYKWLLISKNRVQAY